ncbi:MAG: hydrolase [Bacteroidetes bacterium]|nr:hydrolase [Bacteroidota bacterium]
MILRRFNIRVYGILINEHDHVLVSDELIRGKYTTKFPGGGLELGEGLRDGLIREFQEECGVDVTVTDHYYTTDFYVPSSFDDESQVISIYYKCFCPAWQQIRTSHKKFDFVVKPGIDAEAFRWIALGDLDLETDVNLPIDKVVVGMLIEGHHKVGFKISTD